MEEGRTEVALVGVETSRETVDITGKICTTPATSDSRETHEHRGLLALGAQERGGGDVAPVGVRGEGTMGTGTTSMDSTFRDLLLLKPGHILMESGMDSPAHDQTAGSSDGR